jgi:CTP:molybdopterin cytidylyltransferase MocA
MGRPKLSLPLAGRTVIEHVVTALYTGGCQTVVVVVGPHVSELVPLAAKAGAHVCLLAEPTPDMRATVEHGLSWIERQFNPSPSTPWLLAPADHPTLDPTVVRELLAAHAATEHSIVVPTLYDKRGHPTLLTWRHVAGIRSQPADSGLNVYLRKHRDETLELPVTNESILCDLDTPADYEKLLETFRW